MKSAESLTSYEALRWSNIQRNNFMLKSLGIEELKPPALTASSRTPSRPRKEKFTKDFVPIPGERSSKRIRAAAETGIETNDSTVSKSIGRNGKTRLGASNDNFVASDKVESEWHYVSDYVLDFFKNEDADGDGKRLENGDRNKGKRKDSNPSAVWDLTKKHQHLQTSISRRTVATTGCAGYGAVLASATKSCDIATVEAPMRGAKAGAFLNTSTKSWSIRVLRQGVGGFAVGVANTNARKPFKSLSNRPDSWVVTSAGLFCHNRKEVPVSGVDLEGGSYLYDEGDAIQINVTSLGLLSLSINNGPLIPLPVAGGGLPPGKYTLCCQPYMGGVAKLL